MIDTMIFPTNLSPDNLIINSNFTYVFSTNKSIPYQGWKIHISATLDNYQIILDSVTTICLTNDTPFKFINSIEKLFLSFQKRHLKLRLESLLLSTLKTIKPFSIYSMSYIKN